MRMPDIILKKRDGAALSGEEIKFIAAGAAKNSIPDYQISAWLMAVFFRGLSRKETSLLTRAMAVSGEKLNLGWIKLAKVDKHSTGGVGDGVSLALAPIAASCGVVVPMMSGRGLGHTGGTLDKLESIKGFNVKLGPREIVSQLKKTGLAMFGQTEKLAPSDRKLYALRDATATVESLPLIVASILSKKYAEDLDALVLDVKFGSGSFLKDYKKSRELAVALKSTAESLGMKCSAVMTEMEEPLGRAIGNANEMAQSVKILRGEKGPEDFMEVLEALSARMLLLAGAAVSPSEALEMTRNAVKSGKALEKMREMIKAQGGDKRVADDPDRYLPRSGFSGIFRAGKTGYLSKLDSRTVGCCAIKLGAGRNKAEDGIDHGAGIILERKKGDFVRKGDVVARFYASARSRINDCAALFETAVEYSPRPVKKGKIVREIIT